MQIQDTAAVVTGGGSGIGRAMAVALAERGCSVVVADIDAAGGQATVESILAAGGRAVFHRCDVRHTEDVANTIAAAVEHHGRFDIMCNNAGVGGEDLFGDDDAGWKRMVDINFTAMIEGTRIAGREMRRRGGGGVVVNTASMGGLVPMAEAPVYAATKAGIIHFTRSLAGLAGECGVRVNAICPTYTATPLFTDVEGERSEELKAQVGGILAPEDVAAGLIELVEDDTRAGAIMRVTVRGGRDYAR